jgi:thiamine-phosphate diphosphorylase
VSARRPLPRLHAITDAGVLALADLGVRAAALAAGGSAVALHARDRGATTRALVAAAERLAALARPPEAAVFVNGRADVAAAVGAHGLQLAAGDLTPADARTLLPHGWIGCSIHSPAEAEAAVQAGADYLLLGNVYPTASHPGRPGLGLDSVRAVAGLGRPVIAIGGVDPVRARELKAAGAYGVAAIGALWRADDPAAAALALLGPWLEDA